MPTIQQINEEFPDFVKAARELIFFDKKVENALDKKYGSGSFKSLEKLQEYNKEFDNIINDITNDTSIAKLAQKRKVLFDDYTSESYKVTRKHGFQKTMIYMDGVETYFRELIKS